MKGDGQLKPFIPSWLDEAGLSPAQFRVFCHIARRGQCFGALSGMARTCRMNRESVQAALKHLIKAGLITKTARTGQTSILQIAAEPSGKEGLGSSLNPEEKRGYDSGEKRGYHLAERRGYKGIPSKEFQVKGEAPPSACVNELAGLADWQLSKDLNDIEQRIEKEGNAATPDREMVAALRAKKKLIKDEIKRRYPPTPTNKTDTQPKTQSMTTRKPSHPEPPPSHMDEALNENVAPVAAADVLRKLSIVKPEPAAPTAEPAKLTATSSAPAPGSLASEATPEGLAALNALLQLRDRL